MSNLIDSIPSLRKPPAAPERATNYTFNIAPLDVFYRFLMYGHDCPRYSAGGATALAFGALEALAKQPDKIVAEAFELMTSVSGSGRAPKNDYAIIALAYFLACGGDYCKHLAEYAFPVAVRTAAHLFLFMEVLKKFRGRGRRIQRLVNQWYTNQAPDKLAYQLVKYRSRHGWTHRDVFRTIHPSWKGFVQHDRLARWVLEKPLGAADFGFLHEGPTGPYEMAQGASDGRSAANLVREYGSLTREQLPSAFLNTPEVQSALLERGMPLTALIRSLGPFSATGVVDNRVGKIVSQLLDDDGLRRARVHPVNLLVAAATYKGGRSLAGGSKRADALTWTPNASVVNALEAAFIRMLAFPTPTGKRILIGIDVSSSMQLPCGTTGLSYGELATALALPFLHGEPPAGVIGFADRTYPLAGLKDLTVSQALAYVQKSCRHSMTNAGACIEWAAQNQVGVDAVILITDSAINSGLAVIPALDAYRRRFNIDTKLVVMNLGLSDFSVADPSRNDNLDIAGFDSAVPGILTQFITGNNEESEGEEE